jgi:hypothetical protein
MSTTEYNKALCERLESENRCPVCTLVRDQEFELLRHLQYQITHDATVRTSVAAEGGFCPLHFRRFRKIATAQTTALLMIELVNEYRKNGHRHRLSCRICHELDSYERGLIQELTRLLHEPSFIALYEKRTGLCLTHAETVSKSLPEQVVKFLYEHQRKELERALPDLEAMGTLPYYDTTRSQRSSIPRTVEKFAGREAFGI